VDGRAYSERFVGIMGVDGYHTYLVPVGKRAVVKCITAGSFSGAGDVYVYIAGVIVFQKHFLATESAVASALQLVAYAGEAVTVFYSTTALTAHVDGFLLEDPGGMRAERRPPIHTEQPPWELELGEELPAE
jgi:hypothetical protein